MTNYLRYSEKCSSRGLRTLFFSLLLISTTLFSQKPQDLLNAWNSNTDEDGVTYPGCKQWKVTYPTGEEEKDLCKDVNSSDQEFYYVNATGDGIVFRAPVRSDNGTTPNSDNIRSELRERTIDGDVDYDWTTQGNHVLYVKQAITHLPIRKPELVATQIHGDKSDGIDDAMVVRLEGSHMFLAFNEGDDSRLRPIVTIKNNYVLGTLHEVIFQVIDDKHYCYYSEDGNLKKAFADGTAEKYLVKDNGNPVLLDLNYDEAYFKAGNYTQSNPDEEEGDTNNPDNYGEVIVYDLVIDHKGEFSGQDPVIGDPPPTDDEEEEEDDCTATVPSSRTYSNVGETSATLNWTFDSNFNHYNVRYKPTGASTWTGLTSLRLSDGDFSVSDSTASLTIDGLTEDTTYEWQIRAKCDDDSIATSYNDGAGQNFTTTASIVVTDECTATVPSSIDYSNLGETSVTLNWTYDSNFNHYNVRYKTTNASGWTTITSLRLSDGDISVSGGTASIEITGLSQNTTYEWQVRAKCDDDSIATRYNDGAGPNFTTVSSAGPSCSSGTNLADGATIVDFSAQENNDNNVSNILDGDTGERWSALGFPQYAVVDLGAVYSVNEINLDTYFDRDYQFIVEGSSSSASSGFSTMVNATDNTDNGTINRTFATKSVRYVKLTITGADSYGGSWSSITNFEILCAGSSNKESAEEAKSTIEDIGSLTVYPNPFESSITINSNYGAGTSAILSDLTGKIIKLEKTDSDVLTLNNLEGLSQGIYLLRIMNSQNQILKIKKLVKK